MDQRVEHLWTVFLANIIVLTLEQRTVDWFLARMFCFLSTAFHILINVKAAVYLNTSELRSLHSSILQILRLRPITTVTVQNASDLEDPDLGSPHGRARAEGATSSFSTVNEKCTAHIGRKEV